MIIKLKTRKMKPNEILKKHDLNLSTRCWNIQVTTMNVLSPYIDEDCVIAYLDEVIGFTFIIKTKRSYMAFYGIQKGIYFGGGGYIFRRCEIKESIKLIETEKKGIILNQKEYDKIKDLEILKGLD